MKSLDYGKNYKYAHDFENNFVEENYFPENLKGTQYYYPSENGQEGKLKVIFEKFMEEIKALLSLNKILTRNLFNQIPKF